jgi:hypothetical protein
MINEDQEKQAHENWYKNEDPISYKFFKALSPEYISDFYTSEKAWLARAKAQTVTDTHIMVPKLPTEKFKNDLKQHLDDLWCGDYGCDWDGFVSVGGIDPLKIYALAIESEV